MHSQLKACPVFSTLKPFLLKAKHGAMADIVQSKKREDKNANDLLPITQLCFSFHLHTVLLPNSLI